MQSLERARKLQEILRAIERTRLHMQEQVSNTTRIAITDDAVRVPERMKLDGHVSSVDELERMHGRIRRRCVAAQRIGEIECSKMKNEKKRAFYRAYYLECMDFGVACERAGVNRKSGYRWRQGVSKRR